MVLDLLRDRDRARLLRPDRQSELCENVALVLFGQKASWERDEQHPQDHNDDRVESEGYYGTADHFAQRGLIFLHAAREIAVEPCREPAMAILPFRLEQRSAQGGRQNESQRD